MAAGLAHEKFWVDKCLYHDAEKRYHESLAKLLTVGSKVEGNKKKKVTFQKNKLSNKEEVVSNIMAMNLQNQYLIEPKEIVIDSEVREPKEMVEKSSGEDETPKDKKAKAKENKDKKNKSEKKKKKKDRESKDNKDCSKDVLVEEGKKLGGAGVTVTPTPAQPRSSQLAQATICPPKSSLASEVARARQHIKSSLECMDGIAALATQPSAEMNSRVSEVERLSTSLFEVVRNLEALFGRLEKRITNVEAELGTGKAGTKASAPKETSAEDDDVDLFGSESEEEDEDAKRVREERLAAYAAKKSKKPVLIAKSNIILDVKPWDDETDMKQMETKVREIKMDGLIWGASKLLPLAYGIHKLQISCVVEDDKVSVDQLTETIEEIEQYVQSVDIAAFNKRPQEITVREEASAIATKHKIRPNNAADVEEPALHHSQAEKD